MGDSRLDRLLDQQVAYYRARAGEYDEVFERARADPTHPLAPEGAIARELQELASGRDVLDLACGTGYWSSILVETAASLTAVDAAPEMLALHAERVPSVRVRRVSGDVLTWTSDRRYGLVFFGFWLSHVPDESLPQFLDVVDRALARDGNVAFVDTSAGELRYEQTVEGMPAPAVRRRLSDGREFRIVKVFRSPEQVAAAFAAGGLSGRVEAIGERFLFGRVARTRV